MSKLLLVIDNTTYILTNLEPDPRVALSAWRLVKSDGTIHDVHLGEFGIECTCEDFVWRRERKDANSCKHARALVEQGLLPRG